MTDTDGGEVPTGRVRRTGARAKAVAARLGGDYLGVDVNIAAQRMAEEASADEILVTDRALADLDESALKVRRKRFFRVKGVPSDVNARSVLPRS